MSTEQLVDLVIRLALEQAAPEVKTLVGHKFPDDDVWLCCWMARRFVPKAKHAQIVFVNAGQTLPNTQGDPSVLHFDTGGGEYDQHGKGLGQTQTSSASILAEKLGLTDHALKPLLDLAEAVDNIKPLPATSIHFAIEGYPRMFWSRDKGTDWQKVQERVFEFFEIVYGQEIGRLLSRENLKKYAEWTSLPNGIKIAGILGHPELREAAFEQGATVVVWTQSRYGGFYTGIQVNRQSTVRLATVAETLRLAEANVRGIDVRGKNLTYLGRAEPVNTWFLHDSLKLILNGSRSWAPKDYEFTKLPVRHIMGLVCQSLAAIPKERV